jgi:signal transduction histidine kinase/ligand-binding sensor domain-containing protein/DNA-binding response OmpR family regulator
LWFGSSHGVFRYDGYSFKDYTTFQENTSNVTNAEVQAICDDNEGNMWIGHVQGLDKLNPQTDEVTHYILNSKADRTDWSNHVLALLEDSNGNLWIGTGDGLYLYNKLAKSFKRIVHDSTDAKSIIHNTVDAIYEDNSGTLWFGTGAGLDKLDNSGEKFIHCWNENTSSSNQNDGRYSIISIFEDSERIIWLGTWGGLVEYDRKNNSFNVYRKNPNEPGSLAENYISSISEDLTGNLWIGTVGLDIFDKHTKTFSHHTHNASDPGSLSDDGVSDILVEKSGTIWITTYGRGINKYVQPNQYVNKYFLETAEILNAGWGDLVEDNNGKIWIGTDKGLISFDPDKEIFKEEAHIKDIIGILQDKEGNLWLYSASNGALYYKKDQESEIKQFFYSDGKHFYESVSCMKNCRDGSIWIGTGDGKILKLNQHKKIIEQIAKYDNQIVGLYEDKEGLLWIGTYDAGVISYNPFQKTFTRYISDPTDSSTIGGNQIFNFCEDGQGTLWCLANSSPNKFDRENQKWIRWKGKEGFPDNAMTLVNDNRGNLWMSSASGAFKYNPFTKEVTKYNDIQLSWVYRAGSGELYFISTTFLNEKQSISRINPDNISNNNFIPPIVITSFKKFEKPYPFGKTIELNYTENFLSFEFSALSYKSPEKNQYAYKMEGVDNDWIYPGTRRYASYPNLNPGEYTFRAKGSNSDGVWNEEGPSITIIISPPWWKTWWAYSSYAIILVFSLYGIRRYEMNRLKLKDKVKMDEAVLKEKEETDKMKSRFFANISHEFRTPLTLIQGPAEKIISDTSEDVKKDAKIIRRNSSRLLQLINQLLDLSKLEAGKLKLEASKGNIVSFVKGVALSFESLAESKDITLKLHPEKEFIEMYFDREKMMQIITNILSNALKFTPEEGKITVSIKERHAELAAIGEPRFQRVSASYTKLEIPKRVRDEHTVEIKIRDTGIGIAQEEIPKLFDRFYQVDSSHTREYEGTGIGLALTKELVELHHGSIKVESEKGAWAEFTLEFPLGREHLSDDEIIVGTETIVILNPDEVGMKNLPLESPAVTNNGEASLRVPQNDDGMIEDKTIILVVEDNYDMRQYIRESLNGNYIIEEAVNGEQGVRKAEKIIPDLIISDMMMPKMDGNELVRILKNDEKTSHIPIILLTAKAGQENKLEGLETGADDYLIKPFDIKELQVRIKNLINIRKKLQEKFSKPGYIPKPNWKKQPSIEEEFINKVLQVIEAHISEESFDIESFGEEVGMSRTQFYRKLKAITGMPASIYLRTVRLSKAKKMIEEKQGNISEIAYSVGFSSPSYFTKCFKDEFGYPPSEVEDSV